MTENHLKEELRRAQDARRSALKSRTLLSRRGVQEEWDAVPLEEVASLAKQLKSKGNVDVELLSRLQRALLEGREWTDAFLGVPGAFAALVGHLSGPKPRLALRAAFCICNLSVYPDALNWRLTKAAAPYLMVHLDGMSHQMQEACAWTAGNLNLVDDRSWDILHQLGVLQKLAGFLNHPSESVIQSAVYALTHILLKRAQILSPEELNLIAGSLTKTTVEKSDSSRLLFHLSSSEVCDQQLSVLVSHSVKKMDTHIRESDLGLLGVVGELTFSVRWLANVASGPEAMAVLATLDGRQDLLQKVSLLQPHLRKEVGWLLVNLLRHPSQGVRDTAALLFK